jgi:GGDEF domain-containing protein
LNGGIEVAERIRRNIASRQFPGIGNVTASVGVSAYPLNALTKEDLVTLRSGVVHRQEWRRDRVAYKDQLIMK